MAPQACTLKIQGHSRPPFQYLIFSMLKTDDQKFFQVLHCRHGRVFLGALHSVLDFFVFKYFKVTRSCFPRVSSHKQLLVSRVSPLFLRPFRAMSSNTRFTRNTRFSEMTRLLIWETRSGFYSTRHSEIFPDSILDSTRLDFGRGGTLIGRSRPWLNGSKSFEASFLGIILNLD